MRQRNTFSLDSKILEKLARRAEAEKRTQSSIIELGLEKLWGDEK